MLPEDIKKYDLADYAVRSENPADQRALKKAKDALENDPFFKSKRNSGLAKILKWLLESKRRCEQQAFFMVNPRDYTMPEKILLEKIEAESYV